MSVYAKIAPGSGAELSAEDRTQHHMPYTHIHTQKERPTRTQAMTLATRHFSTSSEKSVSVISLSLYIWEQGFFALFAQIFFR